MDGTSSKARAFAEALGSEIAYWRRRRSMTRAELAEKSQLSESTVGRIERDGPKDVTDTWRIAQALAISFEDLVRRAEESAAMSVLDFGDDAARAQQRIDTFFDEEGVDDREKDVRDTSGA